MADLHVLIRLHRHELDEKRRVLGALYGQMALLERTRREMTQDFEREKEAARAGGDVHFTMAAYIRQFKAREEALQRAENDLEEQIEQAKDNMMETFSELKKYEETQEERDRIEAEILRVKEAKTLDDIGIEGFRRRAEEE